MAEVYVMQKRHKEKMKRMEDERERRGEMASQEKKSHSGIFGRTKKIHPSGTSSSISNGQPGVTFTG